MRILILQIAPATRGRPVPRFDAQLGTLLALLRARGHELSLLGAARPDLEQIKSALARELPQLIYADIATVCVDAARRVLEYIQQHEFLPMVAGGAYPSVDPSGCLSLPGVQAVVIGEPDASLPTYLERVQDPAAGQVVLGIWSRDERGLAQPDLPPLVEDLDSLPFPERELFGYDAHVRQTGALEIAVGRGCPQQCAYCINDWFESIYEKHGVWVRRRSPANILDEIDQLRTRYPDAKSIRFLDHAFALDTGWLSAMLDAYRQRSPLPFRCHLRANALTLETVKLLADHRCAVADIEVISGSDFLRNDIFDMNLSGEQIRAAFEWLHTAKIQTRAVVYLGGPYDCEASLAETHALLREVQPRAVDVRPYYPFPGTRAREVGQDNGWIHVRGEEQYHEHRPGIDMPACRPEEIMSFVRTLRNRFATSVAEPWWRRWSHTSRAALVQILKRKI